MSPETDPSVLTLEQLVAIDEPGDAGVVVVPSRGLRLSLQPHRLRLAMDSGRRGPLAHQVSEAWFVLVPSRGHAAIGELAENVLEFGDRSCWDDLRGAYAELQGDRDLRSGIVRWAQAVMRVYDRRPRDRRPNDSSAASLLRHREDGIVERLGVALARTDDAGAGAGVQEGLSVMLCLLGWLPTSNGFERAV